MASCPGDGPQDQASWAECIRELVDVHYPEAMRIRLVLNNLNTHTGASLYEAFPPDEARRLLDRLEFHHTPKHASWLNMAEIEIGVLQSQCLDRRLDNADWLRSEISAWEERRNKQQVKIHWSFTIAVARHKLKKLYPVIDNQQAAHDEKEPVNRRLSDVLGQYAAGTPGVEVSDNSTVRLDLDNEPQPDALLLIDPACGGQTRFSTDDYIEGSPELVAEVASSSVSYDLHAKLHVYRRNGVREYIVWRVLEQAIDWFVLRAGQYERLPVDAQRTGCGAQVFPGLWLDPAALVRSDLATVLAIVQQGLGSPEHATFVARLHPPTTTP